MDSPRNFLPPPILRENPIHKEKAISELEEQLQIARNEYWQIKETVEKLKANYNKLLKKYNLLSEKNVQNEKIKNQILDTFKIREKFEKEICSICREEAGEFMVTNCGHNFHKNCIKIHLRNNNKCPMCRTKIESSLFAYKTEIKYTYTQLYNEQFEEFRQSDSDIEEDEVTYSDDDDELPIG